MTQTHAIRVAKVFLNFILSRGLQNLNQDFSTIWDESRHAMKDDDGSIDQRTVYSVGRESQGNRSGGGRESGY